MEDFHVLNIKFPPEVQNGTYYDGHVIATPVVLRRAYTKCTRANKTQQKNEYIFSRQ